MKKIIVLSILALTLSLSTAVNAECNCKPEQRGEIIVSATAEKEMAPDTAQITIEVTTYDSKSMQKAAQENKEISDKIHTRIKSIINTQNSDYIKTANYNAQAVYKYVNNKRVFDKYQVSNNVIIKTKSIDKVGSIIDTATSLGATGVNDLNFSLSNYDDQCNDLIAEAAKKAREKANILAKNAMATITGVRSLSVSCNSSANNNRRMYVNSYKMMMATADGAAAAAPEAATPVSAGTIKLNANVNAIFFAK
jgi:uncharacterized protein YggE